MTATVKYLYGVRIKITPGDEAQIVWANNLITRLNLEVKKYDVNESGVILGKALDTQEMPEGWVKVVDDDQTTQPARMNTDPWLLTWHTAMPMPEVDKHGYVMTSVCQMTVAISSEWDPTNPKEWEWVRSQLPSPLGDKEYCSAVRLQEAVIRFDEGRATVNCTETAFFMRSPDAKAA